MEHNTSHVKEENYEITNAKRIQAWIKLSICSICYRCKEM